MTKSTITRERLEEIVSDPMINQGSEFAMMARLALAALDSEPVAYTDDRNLGYIDRGRETAYLWGKQNAEAGDVLLYRHAQQPVVPDEISMSSLLPIMSDQLEAAGYVKGWNAFRAAMLQAGDTVRDLSTPVDPQVAEYEQNVMQAGNSPVIPEGYVMVPKEMTDEIGEAIAMQANCCGGIALDIYDAMLAAAPHDTPALNSLQSVDSVADTWIPVSERMPIEFEAVIAFDGDQVYGEAMYSSDDGFTIDGYDPCDRVQLQSVTHWMPLPAAPQELK